MSISLYDLELGIARPSERIECQADKIAKILQKSEQKFALNVRPELAPLVNWSALSDTPLHRWFRYREAYSPMLAEQLDLGQNLLDPFCGGGSALVGAAQSGRSSVGIDVNPLAIFMTQVKLRPLTDHQLSHIKAFLTLICNLSEDAPLWHKPDLSIADKVFEPVILRCLLQLRYALEEFTNDDKPTRNFLFLAWLAILEPVGNYFKEGNGIKYRNKKRLRSGYTIRPDGWQQTRFGDDQRCFVLDTYSRHLKIMLEDTVEWKKGTWSDQKVVQGTALQAAHLTAGRTFDSVLFSPPYANRFDYFESMKVELWFGDFVQSYADLNRLRKTSLRSHLGAERSRTTLCFEPLEELLALMDREASSWRMGIADSIRGYFDDMFTVLAVCRQLTPKGTCHVVVGNSAFAGVIIPTDLFLAHLGLKAGFKSVRLHTARHLTVAPQQRAALSGLEAFMRETVLEFC